MSHKLINIFAVLVVIAGLVACMAAPWWAVWFICFPVMYAGVIYLIQSNTDWIKNY